MSGDGRFAFITGGSTVLTAMILVAACSSGPAASATATDANPTGDAGTTVTSVYLSNGIPCAVMDGAESKAIDCAWRYGQRQVPPSGVDPKGDRGTTITLVRLADGRQCAVMDGKPGKAISCSDGVGAA